MSRTYTSKFKFETKGMDWNTRDRHIMLITLKAFVIAKAKGKDLVKSRWEQFFIAINPSLAHESDFGSIGVPSFGIALDWLEKNGFIEIEKVPKKRYKLMRLKDSATDKVIAALEKSVEPYDDELEAEILNFIDTFDKAESEGGKYASKEDAFLSIFNSDADIDF